MADKKDNEKPPLWYVQLESDYVQYEDNIPTIIELILCCGLLPAIDEPRDLIEKPYLINLHQPDGAQDVLKTIVKMVNVVATDKKFGKIAGQAATINHSLNLAIVHFEELITDPKMPQVEIPQLETKLLAFKDLAKFFSEFFNIQDNLSPLVDWHEKDIEQHERRVTIMMNNITRTQRKCGFEENEWSLTALRYILNYPKGSLADVCSCKHVPRKSWILQHQHYVSQLSIADGLTLYEYLLVSPKNKDSAIKAHLLPACSMHGVEKVLDEVSQEIPMLVMLKAVGPYTALCAIIKRALDRVVAYFVHLENEDKESSIVIENLKSVFKLRNFFMNEVFQTEKYYQRVWKLQTPEVESIYKERIIEILAQINDCQRACSFEETWPRNERLCNLDLPQITGLCVSLSYHASGAYPASQQGSPEHQSPVPSQEPLVIGGNPEHQSPVPSQEPLVIGGNNQLDISFTESLHSQDNNPAADVETGKFLVLS
jgi:hypothetical protein